MMAQPYKSNSFRTVSTPQRTTTPTSRTLGSLPSELISRILMDLSLISPYDIAACRLVSHSFKDHSSPFLLPCVVFARQLQPLTKLREVLCHPYFRKYVTRLVYDASEYEESTALDWHRYVDDCEIAPRDLEVLDYTDQERIDNIAWDRLNSFGNHDFPVQISSGNRTGLNEQLGRSETVADPETQLSKAFRLGCHTTFGHYVQCQVDQQRIRREKIDAKILAAAFIQFPRLRNIFFTDYRGLARDGESYDICCRRLFGRSLEPCHTGVGGQTNPSGDSLFSLLSIIALVRPARIEGLAVGPHNFEYTGEDVSELADPSHPNNPQYLDISALENILLEPFDELVTILSQLRQLRLTLCYSGIRGDEEHMREQLHKFLRASAPRLQTLTLHIIYLFWGGVREVPMVDNDSRFKVFHSVISPLHMPYLRSLSLRRWVFSAPELRSFLLKHAPTIRDLHLLGCLCGDDEDALARWGGENLNLSGVELSGFLFVVDVSSANLHKWKRVDLAQWRKMEIVLSKREIVYLETLWLADRPNLVERQQRVEIVPGPEWWKQPAYY